MTWQLRHFHLKQQPLLTVVLCRKVDEPLSDIQQHALVGGTEVRPVLRLHLAEGVQQEQLDDTSAG